MRVTRYRKGEDVAQFFEILVMQTYRHAEKVIVVCDNLNVHSAGISFIDFVRSKAKHIKLIALKSIVKCEENTEYP